MEWLCMMAAHVLLGSLWPGSTIDLHRVRHRKLGKTANSVWRQRGAVGLGPTTARTGADRHGLNKLCRVSEQGCLP